MIACFASFIFVYPSNWKILANSQFHQIKKSDFFFQFFPRKCSKLHQCIVHKWKLISPVPVDTALFCKYTTSLNYIWLICFMTMKLSHWITVLWAEQFIDKSDYVKATVTRHHCTMCLAAQLWLVYFMLKFYLKKQPIPNSFHRKWQFFIKLFIVFTLNSIIFSILPHKIEIQHIIRTRNLIVKRSSCWSTNVEGGEQFRK